MRMRSWFRQRPLVDRIALVAALVILVSVNSMGRDDVFSLRSSFGATSDDFYGLRYGRSPLMVVAVAALAAAIRLWSRRAPDSVVHTCLALCVVGSTTGGGSRTMVPLAGWLVVHGLTVRLVFALPSIAAPRALRSASRVASISLLIAAAALLAPFVLSPRNLPRLWHFSHLPESPGWIALMWVAVTLGAGCAGWCVWRFVRPGGRHGPLILQGLWAVAFGAAFSAIGAFVYRPTIMSAFATSTLVLPLSSLALVFAEYGLDGQARRLTRILGSGATPAELEVVLRSEFDDPSTRLFFRAGETNGFVDVHGRNVDLDVVAAARRIEVEVENEVVAVMVAGPAVPASTARRTALLEIAKLAIQRAQLQARVLSQMNDIAESRRRLVEAADHGRRAVERDLHDGAQQRLAALTLSLRMAATAARSEEVALLAKSTAEELHTALAELQELARGIHPAVLTDTGLAAAVESLAERTTVPVTVRVVERRYPPAVELTAYFVIAETLTNVTKHAAATGATVTVTDDGAWLRVVVTDDGRGGADTGAGSGLLGLLDRVTALGGALEIESPDGGGTIVRAELPLDTSNAG